MHYRMKMLPLLLALTTASGYAQNSQDSLSRPKSILTDSVHKLTEVVVSSNQMLGSKFEASNRTGSAYYISPAEILKFGYTDINRMLKSVPGVNVYEEDGYGLRPNISLRGTKDGGWCVGCTCTLFSSCSLLFPKCWTYVCHRGIKGK